MKSIFRLAMVMAVAALFVWTGVAAPAEIAPAQGSFEYYVAMETGSLPVPSHGIFSKAPAEGELIPVAGTWEFNHAMETGSLPSSCVGLTCPDEFTIVEVGGVRYRLGVDDGGGGGD